MAATYQFGVNEPSIQNDNAGTLIRKLKATLAQTYESLTADLVDATQSQSGFMSAEDKTKLDGLEALPSKTGNSGKLLSTDGTSTSWVSLSEAGEKTYSAGTGLALSGTTFNHSNSVTAGTAGTSTATSGSTLDVPYVTYDAQGHVTASGVHTHAINTATTSSDGLMSSTDKSTLDELVGLPSQTDNSGKVLTTNGTGASWDSLSNIVYGGSSGSAGALGVLVKKVYPTAGDTTITLTSTEIPEPEKCFLTVYRNGLLLAANETGHANDYTFDSTTRTLTFSTAFESDETVTILSDIFSAPSSANLSSTGTTANQANKLSLARTIALSGGATGTATEFDGSENITIPVTSLDATKLSGTATIATTGSSGSCTGNAATATTLKTARTIALSGGATGTATEFDGSANISIPVTSLDATKLSGTASVDTTGNAATATKATQDGSGNTITSTYLKVSGGTFNNTTQTTFNRINTSGFITIRSGTSYTNGAYLTLYGQDYATEANQGQFALYARNASAYCGLSGYPDGTLKWGSNAVLTAASTLDATKLSGTATISTTGSSGSCTGNAATATKLATARTINGVSFDGTANISLSVPSLPTEATVATAYVTSSITVPSGGTWLVWGIHVNGSSVVTGTQIHVVAGGSTVSVDSSQSRSCWWAVKIKA